MPLLFKLICMLPVFSVLIIFFSFFGIAQYFVGFIYLLKFMMGFFIIGIQVRVEFPGQFPGLRGVMAEFAARGNDAL